MEPTDFSIPPIKMQTEVFEDPSCSEALLVVHPPRAGPSPLLAEGGEAGEGLTGSALDSREVKDKTAFLIPCVVTKAGEIFS